MQYLQTEIEEIDLSSATKKRNLLKSSSFSNHYLSQKYAHLAEMIVQLDCQERYMVDN